jgi:hypothetical protein
MTDLHCPSCGAAFSVDVALSDAQARQAVAKALEAPAGLGKPLLAYFRLFEPASRRMSWSKFLRLLDELLPMLSAEQVTRDGNTRDCAHATWAQALQHMVEQRARLSLPLSTHGYLLEVASGLAERAGAAAERETEAQRKKRKAAEHAQTGVSPAMELTDELRTRAQKDFERDMAHLTKGMKA